MLLLNTLVASYFRRLTKAQKRAAETVGERSRTYLVTMPREVDLPTSRAGNFWRGAASPMQADRGGRWHATAPHLIWTQATSLVTYPAAHYLTIVGDDEVQAAVLAQLTSLHEDLQVLAKEGEQNPFNLPPPSGGVIKHLELRLAGPVYLPLKTAFEAGDDPLAAFFNLATAGEGLTQLTMSLVLRPEDDFGPEADAAIQATRQAEAQKQAAVRSRLSREQVSLIEQKRRESKTTWAGIVRVAAWGEEREVNRRLAAVAASLAATFAQAGGNQWQSGSIQAGSGGLGYPVGFERIGGLVPSELENLGHVVDAKLVREIASSGAKDKRPPANMIISERVPLVKGVPVYQVPRRAFGYRPEEYDYNQMIPFGWRPNADGKTARVIGIPLKFFRMHGWFLGPTRSGKSWLIAYLTLWLARQGFNVVVMEPSGDINADIMVRLGPEDWERVVFVKPDLLDRWGLYASLNPLAMERPDEEAATQSEVVGVFASLNGGDLENTPRMSSILNACSMTLLEADPEATFYSMFMILTSEPYRTKVLGGNVKEGGSAKNIRNPQLRAWWENVFPTIPQKEWENQIQPLLNRLNNMMMNPFANAMFSDPHSSLNFRALMDKGSLILITLPGAGDPKNSDDPVTSALSKLYFMRGLAAAMDRVDDIDEREERPQTFWFGDEAQAVIGRKSASLMNKLIAQAAKAGLSFFAANQVPSQLDGEALDILTGQTGVNVSFAANKEEIAQWVAAQAMMKEVNWYDLLNIRRYSIYLKAEVADVKRVVQVKTFPLPDPYPLPQPSGQHDEASCYRAAGVTWPCTYQAAAEAGGKERPAKPIKPLQGPEDIELKQLVAACEVWMRAKMATFASRGFGERDAERVLFDQAMAALLSATDSEWQASEALVYARMRARAAYIRQYPETVAHYGQKAMHVMYASALQHHRVVLLGRAANARKLQTRRPGEGLPVYDDDDDDLALVEQAVAERKGK